MTNDLDTFEAQPLSELRSAVALCARDIPARRPQVPRRRRCAMMAAVSTAAAVEIQRSSHQRPRMRQLADVMHLGRVD